VVAVEVERMLEQEGLEVVVGEVLAQVLVEHLPLELLIPAVEVVVLTLMMEQQAAPVL
jgi:hypothetical protein